MMSWPGSSAILRMPACRLGSGRFRAHGRKPDEVLGHMRHDKKAQAGRMSFILARDRQAFISRDVPEDAVRAVLAEG